ncbi:hypothetical protein ANN_08230 [Periplaneta americana]|uniref:Uncharacterized protein n=1 Tax=Periplaneta americana TaxID=6978 RepID=A0ABQ8T0U5_PERAM|nr:hypothetical protein ANN_08230 [Periplaneta americana]
MSPESSTESYPAFAHFGLRENPGKNLNQNSHIERTTKRHKYSPMAERRCINNVLIQNGHLENTQHNAILIKEQSLGSNTGIRNNDGLRKTMMKMMTGAAEGTPSVISLDGSIPRRRVGKKTTSKGGTSKEEEEGEEEEEEGCC